MGVNAMELPTTVLGAATVQYATIEENMVWFGNQVTKTKYIFGKTGMFSYIDDENDNAYHQRCT